MRVVVGLVAERQDREHALRRRDRIAALVAGRAPPHIHHVVRVAEDLRPVPGRQRKHAELSFAVRGRGERLDDPDLLVRTFRGHVEQAFAIEQVLQHPDERDTERLAAASLSEDVPVHRLLPVRHVDRPR